MMELRDGVLTTTKTINVGDPNPVEKFLPYTPIFTEQLESGGTKGVLGVLRLKVRWIAWSVK